MQQPSDNRFLARFYIGWIVLCWLEFFFQKALLHVPDGIRYVPVDVDPTTVVLNNFGIIRSFIQNKWLCYTVDFSIPILAIVALFRPLKGYVFFLLLVSLSLFDIGYAAITFHHQHGLYGLVIMALLFCFVGKEKEFPLIWRAARYIPIFIYLIAFYWKIKGGAFLHPMQGVAVVKENIAYLVANREDSFYAKFIAYFLRNSWLLNTSFTLGFLIEGFFIVGLFTKKMDGWLILLAVVLHVVIAVFVDAYFLRYLIVLLPLLSLEKIRNTRFYKLLSV